MDLKKIKFMYLFMWDLKDIQQIERLPDTSLCIFVNFLLNKSSQILGLVERLKVVSGDYLLIPVALNVKPKVFLQLHEESSLFEN